jgi:hypothetical protein
MHIFSKLLSRKQFMLSKLAAARITLGPIFGSYGPVSPPVHASAPDFTADRAGRSLQFPGNPTDLLLFRQPTTDSLSVTR